MVSDEWAKASQEAAKTTGKIVDAAQSTGGFFAKYIEGPLEQVSGLLTDRLKHARWERQVRLQVRANEFLLSLGVDYPDRRIPLNVAVPLLEAATLEEDDELQDIWAKLLANAATSKSEVDARRMYVTILQDMGPLEVHLLEMIVHAPAEFRTNSQSIVTTNLPEAYTLPEENAVYRFPPENVLVALWNLSRLGCIAPALTFGGLALMLATPTSLGHDFVRACTIRQTLDQRGTCRGTPSI